MATALALISQIEMKIIATDPAKVKWILKEVHMASSVPDRIDTTEKYIAAKYT